MAGEVQGVQWRIGRGVPRGERGQVPYLLEEPLTEARWRPRPAACAEHGLWPAVRGADPGTAILADGFSCRTQIEAGHLGRNGIHLAQLLAGMLPGHSPEPREDR